MRNLLTSFLDQRETIGNLLAPFMTGQPQQFQRRDPQAMRDAVLSGLPQQTQQQQVPAGTDLLGAFFNGQSQPAQQPNVPNMMLQGAEATAASQPATQNMLLQGLEPSQKSVQPLPPPIDVLQQQVADVPRTVDPMPTNSTPHTASQQQAQAKSGGFVDMLSKFGESDFGQRFGDMMLGWGMGGTIQDSLSKGSQMIAAGNQDRKAKKTQNQTVEWLKGQGMSEAEAQATASDRPALNAFLIALRKGVDPKEALQQRKLELEIKSLENPQLSPSDQLAREKFEWDKAQGGVDAPKIVELYDAEVGQPYKATWNAANQTFDRIGGIKAPSGTQLSVGPNGEITFQQGSGLKPLTEGQSKDAVFATRAEGSLGTLNQYGNALAGFQDKMASGVPVVGNYLKSEGYQKAEQAGQEFLQAILRKDTGAAITKEETDQYGAVYLPRPGDSAAVLQQKAASRQRALEALKAGMPPQAILQAEAALKNTDAAYPPIPAGVDQSVWNVMTPEERALWAK